VAVCGALVTSRGGGTVQGGLATVSQTAWWVLAGCGAVVLILGFVATSRWALATAQQTAAELNPENLNVQAVAA
jgi:hypothetical protein